MALDTLHRSHKGVQMLRPEGRRKIVQFDGAFRDHWQVLCVIGARGALLSSGARVASVVWWLLLLYGSGGTSAIKQGRRRSTIHSVLFERRGYGLRFRLPVSTSGRRGRQYRGGGKAHLVCEATCSRYWWLLNGRHHLGSAVVRGGILDVASSVVH